MTQDEASISRGSEVVGRSLHHGFSDSEPAPPPPPKLSSEGMISIDITDKFIQAAKALDTGDLVKDGYFTLFESVGAIEIMDPKMDKGFLEPGESLDPEYDLTKDLLPQEVLGIIDQLLCQEMAWHIGYPLSQTLFTNVYIEAILTPSPSTIEEADFLRDPVSQSERPPMLSILRAYCLGLLKACWYVNEMIKNEQYQEEEDFVTNTYRRTLLDNIDREVIREVIQDARAMIHRLGHEMTEEIATALDLRLELRYAFLRAIELSELRSNPASLKTPWIEMKSILEPIKKSHSLAIPVPEAFSTKLQRRLASTMPPRPIVQLSFDDAYSHLHRLFVDGEEVTDILTYYDSQSLLNFVQSFTAKKPQPLVFVRALLQYFLFNDMVLLGCLSIRQVMDDDLATIALPGSRLLDPCNDAVEAPHDPRFAIAHQMETFRQRAAQPYLDMFRALCQNRCRVRRALCHAVQDWEAIQVDAEEIDQLLQVQLDEEPMSYQTFGNRADPAYSLPLSSWAYLYKLRLMEWIVQLGFELAVYQPDELAGMYWYLNYLAKSRAQHVERTKAFTVRSLNEHRAHHQGFTAGKEAEFLRSLSYLRFIMLDAAVTWELADALSCLYTALHRLGLVPRPSRPYGTDELRYELRMRPFAPIGLPELPSLEAFSRSTEQPDISTRALLDYADKAATGARKGYDVLAKLEAKEAFTLGAHDRWVASAMNCKRAVIAVGIAIITLQQALGAGTADAKHLTVDVPSPEKAYHEWWIVPKIRQIS